MERMRKPPSRVAKSAFGGEGRGPGTALMGTELFASVIVGALLGWFVGQVFGIRSFWPLLIGLAIGAVAGFREIYRYIMREIDRERAAGGRR